MNRKDFLWKLAGGAASLSLVRCSPGGAAIGAGARAALALQASACALQLHGQIMRGVGGGAGG